MPVSGGGGPGGNASGKVLWRENWVGFVPCCRNVSDFTVSPPDDLPAGTGAIVNNAGTIVDYIGGGQYSVTKNGGVSGTFDSDAVSSASIAGDVEVIIDWASGSFMAGLNSTDPTTSSSYPSTFTVFLYWDAAGNQVYVMQFGNFVGLGHTFKPYGKIVFNAAADTISVYTSDDRVTWGTALETFTGVTAGSLGSPHYFDSTLSTSGAAFNVVFDIPPLVLAPSLFTNSQTFYSATVTPGTATLSPSLFTNSQSFFAPTVTSLVTLAPSLFTNSQTFFAPSVAANYSLAPALFTNGQTFFAPTVGRGAVGLAPSLYTNSQTYFAPTVTRGAVNLSPPLLADGNTFFSPTVTSAAGGLQPSLFTNANSFFGPTLTSTYALIAGLWANPQTFYGPTSLSLSRLFPLFFSNGQRFYRPKMVSTLWHADADPAGSWTDETATGTWTPEPVNDDTWTPETEPSGTWADEPRPSGTWS